MSTFVDEETGEVRDFDEYAAELAVAMVSGGSTIEEVDEAIASQRLYLTGKKATKEATPAQTDALLYVLDLWSKERFKFNEADWVRNRGRFADYVGRHGGGHASGAGTADDPLKFSPAWIGGGPELQKELVPHFRDWAATVTPSEREALIDYAKDSYSVNSLLRGQVRPDTRPLVVERQARLREEASLIDSALSRASSPEMVVYRGLGFEGSRVSLKQGDMFADRAFTSTSVNSVNAADFGGQTVAEIRIPKGSHAVAVNAVINPTGTEHVPGTRNEAEVLIARGGVYRVTGQREETVTYAIPAGGTQSQRLRILEMEMVNDAGDVPQLGAKARGGRSSYHHLAWGEDDIVLLTPEPPAEKVRRLLPEALKFVESDWVRNSGRFADFVGRSGGGGKGGGGSSGASTEFAKQLFDVPYDAQKRAEVVALIKSQSKYDPSTWERDGIYERKAADLPEGFTVRSQDTFGVSGTGGGGVIASNRTGGDGTIHINAEAWDRADPFGREVLLHHELGHNAARVMLADGSGQKVMGFYPNDGKARLNYEVRPFGDNANFEEQLADASGNTTSLKGIGMTGMPNEYDKFAGPRDLDSESGRNRARVYTNVTAVNEALGYKINPQTREAVDRYRAMEGYGETWPG